jgi:hypothetical protein
MAPDERIFAVKCSTYGDSVCALSFILCRDFENYQEQEEHKVAPGFSKHLL